MTNIPKITPEPPCALCCARLNKIKPTKGDIIIAQLEDALADDDVESMMNMLAQVQEWTGAKSLAIPVGVEVGVMSPVLIEAK